MNIFKKLFSKKGGEKKVITEQKIALSLENSFVHYFIQKGGKFLYNTSLDEVKENLFKIINENNIEAFTCFSNDLKSLIPKTTLIKDNYDKNIPFFTTCEHLISDNGNILFSSNQLQSNRLNTLSNDFIVYATTSQLVKNTGEGLTGIKTNYAGNIPTNISAVKNYTIAGADDNFLNSTNSNSKNLYLLLFEDL